MSSHRIVRDRVIGVNGQSLWGWLHWFGPIKLVDPPLAGPRVRLEAFVQIGRKVLLVGGGVPCMVGLPFSDDGFVFDAPIFQQPGGAVVGGVDHVSDDAIDQGGAV